MGETLRQAHFFSHPVAAVAAALSLTALSLTALGGCGGDPATSNDVAAGTDGATTGGTTTGASSGGGAAASGPATSGAGAAGGAGGPATTTGGGGAPPSDSPGCLGDGLEPGDHTVELEHGGSTRSYILHIPPGLESAAPTPLVVNMHGLTSNANQQIPYSGMSPVADANGFIVAYPNGIGSSWNGGACCGQAANGDVDDVDFIETVVADVGERSCIDEKRVYATGMSNGGFMSNRLGCESADVFAAIAPVAGVLGIDEADCNPVRPVPIMHFHGTNDLLVNYDGGLLFIGAQESVAIWAARNGCGEERSVTFENGAVTCESYDGCTETTLCTIAGAGHCWPGQGFCNDDISASEAMWTFFSGHALP